MATETLQAKTDATDGKEQTRSTNFYRPVVDIVERSDELLIFADMPGVKVDQVDIRFEDGSLRIHGRVDSREVPDARSLLREYGVGDFFREFQVSETIDVAKITAELEDGVLVVHLPKVGAVKPRKIEVTTK
jgi:HSP20 family protein